MAKTQTEVLSELFKKLGYSAVADVPPKSILEEKLLSGNLTVREAVVLDMYSRGIRLQEATKQNPVGKKIAEVFPAEGKLFSADAPAPSSINARATAVINSTQKAGFSLDTNFKAITNDREAMEKIAGVTKAIDPHWSGVYNSLKVAHTQATGDEPFLYQNPKEKAAGLAGAKQTRGTRKFDGVPPAKDAFPEIVAGLSQVEDATTRNALIASSLAPYRPGEISNLRLGQYDLSTIEVDRPPGYFDVERGAIVFPEGRTGNKAAQDLILDKNSILYQTLAQQAQEAQDLGSSQLFPEMTTDRMTSAIQQHIMPRMAKFEDILGRPFDRAQDFRKLVSSMIVGELGYAAEAEKMLGHSDAQLNNALTAVGQKHYISTIIRNSNPLAAVQLSLENMIGEAIGAQTLNETAASFGLDIPGYTDESAQPVTITRTGEQLSEVAEVAPREMTPEELASLDARREEASANARLAAQQAEQQALTLEEENLKRRAELEGAKEAERERKASLKSAEQAAKAVEEKEALKFTDDEKKGLSTFFNKVLGRKGKAIVTGVEAGLGALGISAGLSERAEADPRGEVTPGEAAGVLAEELTVPGMIMSGAKEAPGLIEEGAQFLAEPVEEAVREEAEQKGISGDTESQMQRMFGIPPNF